MHWNLRKTRLVIPLSILVGVLVMAACGTPEQPTQTFTLEVSVTGAGSGSVTSSPAGIDVASGDPTASATFERGTVVTLTAVADDGSTFTTWTGGGCTTGECVVTMNSNRSVTATFGLTDQPPVTATLTVVTSGTGTGNVTSSPAGIDLDAGNDSVEFDVGETVTLTADADGVFAFGGWSGAGCIGTGTCVFEITGDVTVTADFFDPATETTTATFAIAQGTDDAEEFLSDFGNPFYSEGGTTVASSDLDLTYDAAFDVKVAVGLRYAEVNLPRNAVVTNATITFTRFSGSLNPGSVTLDFVGQASDDAPTFVEGSANFNITNRDTTTAEAAWFWAGPWSETTATSPDLSSIVSEVLQRDGWSSGNALAFVITSADSNATNYRRAISYENDPASAPVLSLTYYVPTAP